jgi:hypothetical protein
MEFETQTDAAVDASLDEVPREGDGTDGGKTFGLNIYTEIERRSIRNMVEKVLSLPSHRGAAMSKTNGDTYSKQQTEQRRDEAVRRALNTPPKPYKESKVGKKKRDASRKR